MTLGFTGSRTEPTDVQKKFIKRLLLKHKPTLVVHGGCVGSDESFDLIAWILKVRRRCYPGAVSGIYRFVPLAAFEEKFPIRDPLARNADIVAAADLMVATPDGPERLRSGTWSTIRLAKRMRKPIVIVMPDGTAFEYDKAGVETTTWPAA